MPVPEPLDADPDAVLRRMLTLMPQVGSVWFPTAAELGAWRSATSPLYVRRIGREKVEIGPKTYSVSAARLCPVLRVELVAEGGRTRLSTSRRFTGLTTALFVLWAVVLIGAGIDFVLGGISGARHPIWLAFWGALAVMATTGAALGWSRGGRALDEALPWLWERLGEREPVHEDWT